MTGFGRSEKDYSGLRISVEIRTVNNRFCDIGLKIPRNLNPIEAEIREHIRSRVNRGRINILITVDYDTTDKSPVEIDSSAAKACYKELHNLNEDLGNSVPVTLNDLLHFSELFTGTPDRIVTDEFRHQVIESLDSALDDLVKMRRNEGLSLAKDIISRIREIEGIKKNIEKLAAKQSQQQFERLQERLEHLLNAGPMDPGRLEQEMAIIADKLGITE